MPTLCPSWDQIKSWSDPELKENHLSGLLYDIMDGEIQSLTWVFANDVEDIMAPPEGTYTDDPTRPFAIPQHMNIA